MVRNLYFHFPSPMFCTLMNITYIIFFGNSKRTVDKATVLSTKCCLAELWQKYKNESYLISLCIVKNAKAPADKNSRSRFFYCVSMAYCTIMGSSYSAHIERFSSSVLSCSVSSAVSSKSKISRFSFIRSLCVLFGIATMPR